MVEKPDSEESVEHLIREAGRRPPIPDDVRGRLEHAFRAELKGTRYRRRLAIAASVAVITLAFVGFLVLPGESPPVTAGFVDVVQGDVEWSRGAVGRPLLVGKQLRSGEHIRTAEGRARIEIGGAGLRIDRETAVQVVGSNRYRLESGSIYVDSRRADAGIVIETPRGLVEHFGTQFLVDVEEEQTTIGVREGSVRIVTQNSVVTASAANGRGELIRLNANDVSKLPMSSRDERWHWVNEISPRFDTNDRPVHEFLVWVARESGRTLTYADASIERRAKEARLKGSLETTVVDRALRQALSTTSFYLEEPLNGELSVQCCR